jgi:hypothetical protein
MNKKVMTQINDLERMGITKQVIVFNYLKKHNNFLSNKKKSLQLIKDFSKKFAPVNSDIKVYLQLLINKHKLKISLDMLEYRCILNNQMNKALWYIPDSPNTDIKTKMALIRTLITEEEYLEKANIFAEEHPNNGIVMNPFYLNSETQCYHKKCISEFMEFLDGVISEAK